MRVDEGGAQTAAAPDGAPRVHAAPVGTAASARRQVPVPVRWAVLVAGLLAMAAVLLQQAPAQSRAATPPAGTAIHLAAVGDSITAADASTVHGGRLVAGRMGHSWVATAATGDVVLDGGWAHWGATTAQMAAAVRPAHADVLVVLAGTNDTRHGIAFSVSEKNLEKIVTTVGARHVVVSAIPPRDGAPAAAVAYNTQLRVLAAQQGWTFTDPMGAIRSGDHYGRGMTHDGLHPTHAAAAAIGTALHDAIERAARS